MKYAASTGGFYLSEIHLGSIPADAVEITDAQYDALIAGQSGGQQIASDASGMPVLIDPFADPLAVLAAERAGMICSRFQARAALHMAGLLVAAEAAIAAAPMLTQIAWADAQQFQRLSPTIAGLAPALGLTDIQIDALFRAAMQITA